MAIKRTAHIVVTFSDGTTLSIDGDGAVSVLSAWQNYLLSDGVRGASYTNASDNQEWLSFRCVCRVEILPQTEEEIDDRPCVDNNCPPEPDCTSVAAD